MRVLVGAGVELNEGRYTSALAGAGYIVAATGSADRGEEAVLALVNAQNAVSELGELRAEFPRVRPILIGEPMSFFDSPDLALAAAPILSPTASTEDLLRTLEFLARGVGWLARELVQLDSKAKQLVMDELCGWVRSRPGIIGIIQLARLAPTEVPILARRLIGHAHGVLDRLPREQLSVEDIWNVTLLISVPMKESELDRHSEIAKLLDEISHDLTGSRKVVLWFDRHLSDYFGSLGEGQHNIWKLSSDDPLRQTLDRVAIDLVERQALEVIFKRRLSQQDIEDLFKTLGKQS
jgi:hypothetical protein